MINEKVIILCRFKCMSIYMYVYGKNEKRWKNERANSPALYLLKIEEMVANTHHFRFNFFTNGWVV